MIDGNEASVIIDTGASASFIPQLGSLLSERPLLINSTPIKAKTADNTILRINSSVKMATVPSSTSIPVKIVKYYILPNCLDIMGHQAIMGLDAIKMFDVKVMKEGDSMCAYSGDFKIGEETHRNTLSPPFFSEFGKPTDLGSIRIENDAELNNILKVYSEVFAETVSSSIRTSPMPIELNQEFQVKAKLKPHSLEDIQEMYSQIKRLLENNIIERTTSPYSCNAHLVPKKTGQRRLVVNFIPLNSIAVKDHYPMPHISDLFNSLRDSRYFCALDCTEGFFQIPVLKEHRERTAFITPHGMFQFKRCPFGFTNSPAKFQQTMNSIFEEGLYERCVVYIDDILIMGKTKESVLDNLRWVLDKCVEYNVKLKLSKCKFMKESVEFLGHLISHNSISPVPNKNDPIFSIKPKNKTDVLALLGTLNYYSKFIPDYTEKTKLLRELIRKDANFGWKTIHDEAVSVLKADLTNAVPHEIPETYSDKLLEITTHTSTIEATCTSEEGRLISRAGSVLSLSESNYTPVEKTLMGIVLAYNKFGAYLKGSVTVKTPLKALVTALQMKERTDRINRLLLQLPPEAEFRIQLLPRIRELEALVHSEDTPDEIFYTDGACTGNGKPDGKASWAILATMNSELSRSGLVTHHKPTNQVAELTAVLMACEMALQKQFKNIVIVTDSKYVADSLNKWLDTWTSNGWKDNRNKPVVNTELLRKLAIIKEQLNVKCIHVKGHSDNLFNNEVDNMARAELENSFIVCGLITAPIIIDQSNDIEIGEIISKLDEDVSLQEKFTIIDGKLYFVDPRMPAIGRHRLVVPSSYRKQLLATAHDDPIYGGHLGVKKTFYKLRKYYWKHMRADIEHYILSCENCQRYKTPIGPKPGLLQPIPTSKIFERLHMDIIGPICSSDKNNKYIITAIDAFSRYGYARARHEVKTIDILEFLQEEIISKHGIPEEITSDNGSQFTSTAFGAYMEKLGIKHKLTCAYHPQANGMDERFNGTLIKILRNYIDANQRNWDDKLMWALLLYNTTPNESTSLSPYTILFGVEPRSPLNLLEPTYDPSEYRIDHQSIREIAGRNATRAHQVQKFYYDRKHKPQDFKVMDMVLQRSRGVKSGDAKKLAFLWVGPYMITKMIRHNDSEEPQAALLLDLSRMTREEKPVAFVDLKPYSRRSNGNDDMEDLDIARENQDIPAPLPGAIMTQPPEGLISAAQPSTSQPSVSLPNFNRSHIPVNIPTRTYGRLQNSAVGGAPLSNPLQPLLPTVPLINRMHSCPTATSSNVLHSDSNTNRQISTSNLHSCPTATSRDAMSTVTSPTSEATIQTTEQSPTHSHPRAGPVNVTKTNSNYPITEIIKSTERHPTTAEKSQLPDESLLSNEETISQNTLEKRESALLPPSTEEMDLEPQGHDNRGIDHDPTPPRFESPSSPPRSDRSMQGIAQNVNSTPFPTIRAFQAQLSSTPFPVPVSTPSPHTSRQVTPSIQRAAEEIQPPSTSEANPDSRRPRRQIKKPSRYLS